MCRNSVKISHVLLCCLCVSSTIYFYAMHKHVLNIHVLFTERTSTESLQFLLQGHIDSSTHVNACKWPPERLYGRQKINKTKLSFEMLEEIYFFMEEGHYRPFCQPYQKIAIIVPYRLREEQFKIFLNNVIPKIYRQNQEFAIYLVEQADFNPFNKGMLVNIGYQHAIADREFDCIVVHDVDVLPEDDRNLYFCGNQYVYHLSGKIERKNYSLLYERSAGGIISLSISQYKNINGFSNAFCGWGGEDDDFEHRVNSAGYKLLRPLLIYSHSGDVEHPQAEPNKQRYHVLDAVRDKWQIEGLNSLQFDLIKKEKKKLFTWILTNTHCSVIKNSADSAIVLSEYLIKRITILFLVMCYLIYMA